MLTLFKIAPLALLPFLTPRQEAVPAETNTSSVAVLCEAWSISDPDLRNRLETQCEAMPGNADAIRSMLDETFGDGVARVARFIVPVAMNTQMSFRSNYEAPITRTTTSQNSTQTSFDGYQKAGTTLQMQCRPGQAGTVNTRFQINVSGFEDSASEATQPPARSTAEIEAECQTEPGELRVFLFGTGDSLVVFLRATTL